MSNYVGRYWKKEGQFSDKYEAFIDEASGKDMMEKTSHEALRCLLVIEYDIYNNGFCNWDVKSYHREHALRFLRKEEENQKISKELLNNMESLLVGEPNQSTRNLKALDSALDFMFETYY